MVMNDFFLSAQQYDTAYLRLESMGGPHGTSFLVPPHPWPIEASQKHHMW